MVTIVSSLVATLFIVTLTVLLDDGQAPRCSRDSECGEGERCITFGDLGHPNCTDGKSICMYTWETLILKKLWCIKFWDFFINKVKCCSNNFVT